MAINNQDANSPSSTLNFSSSIDAIPSTISSLNLSSILGVDILNNAITKVGSKSPVSLLDETINNIDTPILKDLCLETLGVLKGWFTDPQTLCCLVQGIWASYLASNKPTKGFNLKVTEIHIKNVSFAQFIDLLITFIDLIIVLLTNDMKKFSFFMADFLEEIADAVMGAVFLVIQETLKSIKDSLLGEIIIWIDKAKGSVTGTDNIWAKCLPLDQLFNVIKKYVSDYGMFAKLMDWIKSLHAKQIGFKGFGGAKELLANVKDLEFLYWFRDFLVKLKQALINFDLCVGYDYIPEVISSSSDKTIDSNNPSPFPPPNGEYGQLSDPTKNTGFQVAADGSILLDKNMMSTAGTITAITNAQMKPFLVKYMGYPSEVVDNMIAGSTSMDHIQGSNINSTNPSNIAADCPNSPDPASILNWVYSIRYREK
jgi:hypothetical protein